MELLHKETYEVVDRRDKDQNTKGEYVPHNFVFGFLECEFPLHTGSCATTVSKVGVDAPLKPSSERKDRQ